MGHITLIIDTIWFLAYGCLTYGAYNTKREALVEWLKLALIAEENEKKSELKKEGEDDKEESDDEESGEDE